MLTLMKRSLVLLSSPPSPFLPARSPAAMRPPSCPALRGSWSRSTARHPPPIAADADVRRGRHGERVRRLQRVQWRASPSTARRSASGPLASTQMACADPVGQEEQAFLLAMERSPATRSTPRAGWSWRAGRRSSSRSRPRAADPRRRSRGRAEACAAFVGMIARRKARDDDQCTGPGPEPELRAAQRLRHQARLPAARRGEGGAAGQEPPGHPYADDRDPGAIGHPPPVPREAAAAAGQAQPARGLRARPPHLPVLRHHQPRPDDRPRHAQASRRAARVGEPRRRLPWLQPPQGRQDPGRGADAPAARAARAARRPALPVRHLPVRRAQRRLADVPLPGAGPSRCSPPADGGRRAPPDELDVPDLPDRVRSVLDALADAGHEAALVGGSRARSAAGRCPRRRLGRGDLGAAGGAWPRSSPVPPGRTGSGRSPSGRTPRSRSPPIAPRAATATGAARTRCASACPSPTTSRGATSRSTPSPGCPMRPGRGRAAASSTPPVARPTSRRASCARSAIRTSAFTEDALRFRAASGSPAGSSFGIDPADRCGADRRLAPTCRRRLGRAGPRRAPRASCGCDHRRRRARCCSWSALGLLAILLPELAALRGDPAGQAAAGRRARSHPRAPSTRCRRTTADRCALAGAAP